MNLKNPHLEGSPKRELPIGTPQLFMVERIEPDEEMIPDGKFPVKMVENGSYHLLEYITHNEQNANPEDKQPFVYIDEDAGSTKQYLPEHCPNIHELLERLRSIEGLYDQKIDQEAEGKKLSLKVIDGEKVKAFLPDIWALISKFQPLAERLWGGPLVPINDKAAVNINFIEPGGEQGFHYDRNEVTLLLQLTSVQGGELEFKPDSKSASQYVNFRTGKLVGLVGANKVYHRVRKVEQFGGTYKKRVVIALGFGLPGKNYEEAERDNFLYTNEKVENQKVFGKDESKAA